MANTMTSRVRPVIKCKQDASKVIAELPPPRGDNYSKLEVIRHAILYGKAAVIKAIDEAKCYQKKRALQKLFPGEGERYNDEIVRALMAKYTVGSAEWQERAEDIADSTHGPRLRQIYNIFGHTILVVPQSADAACDAEVSAINAGASDPPSPPSALTRSIPPIEAAAAAAASALAPSSDLRAISISPDTVTAAAHLDSSADSAPKKSSKRPRSEIRSDAALALAPNFVQGANIDTMEWQSTETQVCTRTIQNGAKDMRGMMMAIGRGDASRTASIIAQFLKHGTNDTVRQLVLQDLSSEDDKDTAANKLIVESIQESIAHHTKSAGGTRTKAAETFVKYVVASCLFKIVRTDNPVTERALRRIIGTTSTQISQGRSLVRCLIDNNVLVSQYERQRRKDYICEKLEAYQYDFLLDDMFTRLDTKQTLVEVINPRTREKELVHKRIWYKVNRRQQLIDFRNSDHYVDFQNATDGATVGYDVWRRVLKKVGTFVCRPVPESCVDEVTTQVEHHMAALLDLLKKDFAKEAIVSKVGRARYESFVEILRKAGYRPMMEEVLCQKEEQPDLHIDESKPCPMMHPFKCTHGSGNNKCSSCGVDNKIGGILGALSSSEEAHEKVEVNEWVDAERSGGKTQKELQSVELTIKELSVHFEKQLKKCIPHYQEILWMDHLMDTDLSQLPEDGAVMFTDFASTMDLRASQAVNSSIDGHAINCTVVILYNRRTVDVKEKKMENDIEIETTTGVQIFTVDVIHAFAPTISKGKKNDHQCHNTVFDDVIRTYKQKFESEGRTLRHITVWTDNAPNQYRCRQNFIKTASIAERHPDIQITHRLAVVSNFKGVWDAYGKAAKYIVRLLELEGVRSATAFAVFKNCVEHLEKSTGWAEYERTGDEKLKGKGKFGMDSRYHLYVVETKEEYDRLSPQFPGRILLCDRASFVQDTLGGKSIAGTKQLHEIRSVAKSVPSSLPRKWPVRVSNLPCNCTHCSDDPDNTLCKYSTWRKTRTVEMQIALVSPKEAMSWVGCGVAKEVDGQLSSGRIMKYDAKEKTWHADFDDGENDVVFKDYVDCCMAKQLYDDSFNDDSSDV